MLLCVYPWVHIAHMGRRIRNKLSKSKRERQTRLLPVTLLLARNAFHVLPCHQNPKFFSPVTHIVSAAPDTKSQFCFITRKYIEIEKQQRLRRGLRLQRAKKIKGSVYDSQYRFWGCIFRCGVVGEPIKTSVNSHFCSISWSERLHTSLKTNVNRRVLLNLNKPFGISCPFQTSGK